MNLKLKAKILLEKPGVYLMKDSLNNIIYVGKSKNLKDRVSSYFRNNKELSDKVKTLKLNIKDFNYVYTDTEFEALLLESILIKKIKPRYNRLLKEEQKYNYIKITIDDEYPIITTTENKEGKGLYIGPFSRRNLANEVARELNDNLPLRKCKSIEKKKICSYHSMKKCLAPCHYSCKEEYDKYIHMVISYFNGDDKSLEDYLKKLILYYSEELKFEKALMIKNLKENSNKIFQEYKNIVNLKRNNIFLMGIKENDKIIKIFVIKNGIIKFMYNLHRYKNHKILIGKIFNDIATLIEEKCDEIKKEDLDEINIIKYCLKNTDNMIYENVALHKIKELQGFEKYFLKFTN